jgi:hypothetical protein
MALTTLEQYANSKLTPVQDPQDARWTAGVFGPSLTLAAGTVLGKKTADGKLYAYVDANADGTQTAVGYLMYAINTDASGQAYLGGSATASSLNPPFTTAPYFYAGTFDPADLTGNDAAANTDLKVTTLQPSGYLRIG